MIGTLSRKALGDVVGDNRFWDDLGKELSIVMIPVAQRILLRGAERAQGLGVLVDMDAIHQPALNLVRTWLPQWWAGLEMTTRQGLRAAYDLWLSEGLGKRGLPDLIETIEPLFGPERAERIGVTETTRLFAQAEEMASAQDENIGGETWMTAEDEKVCAVCGPRDHKVYAKGQVPACPAHVRCRCALAPATWDYIRAHPSKWQGGEVPPGRT